MEALYNIYLNLFEFISYRKININDDIKSRLEFIENMKKNNHITIKCEKIKLVLISDSIIPNMYKNIIKLYCDSDLIAIINSSDYYKKNISSNITSLFNENSKLYSYEPFLFNVPQHTLVPEHVILSDVDTNQLCEYLSCDKFQLPIIYDTDPIIIWINGKVGQIVQIKRTSEIGCYSYYYRQIKKHNNI
jgi:DNA-directed RNA polymerase subunit H